MFGIIGGEHDKSLLFLREVKGIVCGVSNVGESEMIPTIDLFYPTLYQKLAIKIAKRMRELGEEPIVHINRDTQELLTYIHVTLVLPVDRSFIESCWGEEDRADASLLKIYKEATQLKILANWEVESQLTTQFLRKYSDQGAFKVEVGRLSPLEKVSIWGRKINIYTDGYPNTIN